jgi:pyoverdine/dityrosine biosynthesis protein Dit1/AcrR family transcriptional regulator
MSTHDRARILTAAFTELGAHGYDGTTMVRIAARAGLPLHRLYGVFPARTSLALAVYEDLAHTLAERMVDLPCGPAAARLGWWLQTKLDLMDTRRPALLALAAAALDPDGPLGVTSDATRHVRSRVAGQVRAVLAGATDAPADLDRTTRLVYGAHLLLVLLWTQDPAAARAAIPSLTQGLALLPLLPISSDLEARWAARLPPPAPDIDALARELLRRLLRRRRLAGEATGSEAELAPHLPVLTEALRAGRPLRLVLPAFPAKSPNPGKTLGPLPDLGERVALVGLQALCDELAEAWPAGVELWLCSDGTVFADVVEVADADVAAYGQQIDRLIADLPSLRRFDLADVYGELSPAMARRTLLDAFGEDPAELAERCRGPLGHTLDGLHRFVFEDLHALHPELSRTRARELARGRALEVLRRSRAWGALVAAQLPDALRLSIHPQPAVSDKIGVHLLPTDDVWLTPWHGVAAVSPDGVTLLKRADAEARGWRRVEEDGRGSHFVVDP